MKKIKIQYKDKLVTAKLSYFSKNDIIIGVNRATAFRPKFEDSVEKYKGLKLCNYKKLWWIYYSENNMTGHFASRKESIEWFKNAGR